MYSTKFYNLDVIISVGYRVKSQRGTQFRIWANKVLKDYLLKGYSVNQRFEKIETSVLDLKKQVENIDIQIRTNLPPTQGIFFDGQIFDAWFFVSTLIKGANFSIVLIDNYIDETILNLLSKRKENVSAKIYTSNLNKQIITDVKKFNSQYTPIILNTFKKSHDRFLIIDESIVYHIGASLKDLGKKWFAFSKINLDAKEILEKLNT